MKKNNTTSERVDLRYEAAIEQMLDSLPRSFWNNESTFCDVEATRGQAVVPLVKRLRALGHSKAYIREHVFVYSTSYVYVLMTKNALNKIGAEVTFLETPFLESTMTFDVIVGNPPYQDPTATNSKKLWPYFLKKSASLLNPNGYMALISPQAWMEPGKMFDYLTKNFALLWVDTTVRKYFGTIGSTFCAFIIQNAAPKQFAMVDNQEIDLSMGLIPQVTDSVTISILNKVLKTEKKFSLEWKHEFDSRDECYGKDKTKKTQQTQERKYPIFHTNIQTLYSSVKHPYQTLPKVLVTKSGYWKPFYDEKMGATEVVYLRRVSSKEEGKRVVKILDSKLFHFIIGTVKRGGLTSYRIVKLFPYLDTSINWTDEAIYKHFKLTQEERDHIDAFVK